MPWRERREGERAYERHGSSSRYENPHKEYGSYDESRAHRDWDEGRRDAERQEERRREEREEEERQERRREHERQERQYQRECEEREYYERQEAEQFIEQCCDEGHEYNGDDEHGGRCYCGEVRYPTGGPMPDEEVPN